MNFFKRIYGVIVRPKATLEEISDNAPVWQGIAVLVILSLIPMFTVFNRDYIMNNMGPGVSGYEIDMFLKMIPFFMAFGVFGAMILSPIFHFVSTGIYNLLAEFFGHSGRGKGLFSAMAFANIPGIFSVLLTVILRSARLNIMGLIASIIIGIWIIVLKIFAISKTYKTGGGKATLIYFIPAIVIIVLIGIMILVSIISLIPLIQSIGDTLEIPSI